jgi:hypothetical protein
VFELSGDSEEFGATQLLSLAKSFLKRIGRLSSEWLKWKLIRSSAEGGGKGFTLRVTSQAGDFWIKDSIPGIQYRLRGGGKVSH